MSDRIERALSAAERYGPFFAFAVANTLIAEGLFSDDALDPGGETMHGITVALARRHGYPHPMSVMPVETAVRIYHDEFWAPQNLDSVRSKYIAAEIFDTSVNTGTWWGPAIAQATLILFGHDIALDGQIGPQTLGAINSELPKYEKHLYHALNGMQFVKYVIKWKAAFKAFMALAKRADSAHRRRFVKGWMRRGVWFPEMAWRQP